MSISKEEKRKHQEENLNKKNLEKESQNKNEECSKTAENSQVEQSDIDLKAENDKNKALADEYLNLAKVIQADFENYRKRSLEQIEKAKIDGMVQVVELMLPSLDAFKKAKENIKDENTLSGINMLEKAIESGFKKLGIEKIEAVGKPLDPNVHNVLAVAKDEQKEDGIILEEFQAGYKLKNKVIRCSQVLVNKL